MDPQFEELAQVLKKELAVQFAAAEGRLVAQYKIHAEEMQTQAKLAAEGYGATLEGIERSLKDLATKWDSKIARANAVVIDG